MPNYNEYYVICSENLKGRREFYQRFGKSEKWVAEVNSGCCWVDKRSAQDCISRVGGYLRKYTKKVVEIFEEVE